MIFDERSLEIIGESYGWNEDVIRNFVGNHYMAISKLTMSYTLQYMAEDDLERVKEINRLMESDQKEDNIRGHRALTDQIELYGTTYPELEERIKEKTLDYEEAIFWKYLEIGPLEGVLKLLKYMQDKLDKADYHLKIIEIARKRKEEGKVREVLES